MAHPDLVHGIESGKIYEWLRGRGNASCFRIELVKRWLEDRAGPFTYEIQDGWRSHQPHRGLLPLSLEHAQGVKELTQLWIDKRQLFVIGPNSDALAPLLVPHEVINANSIVGVFREDLRVRNPFRADEFAKLISDAQKKGLDLSKALASHRSTLSTEPAEAVRVRNADGEVAARAFLREISNRKWNFVRSEGSASSHPRSATWPFWFRRAAEAPLIVFAADPNFDLWALASMGAGRVLWVRAKRFSATTPVALRVTGSMEVDGGDVHLWLGTGYDEMLEAESLVPRRHRHEEAEAEHDDD